MRPEHSADRNVSSNVVQNDLAAQVCLVRYSIYASSHNSIMSRLTTQFRLISQLNSTSHLYSIKPHLPPPPTNQNLKRKKTYHTNPNMNPPTLQKLPHHRPLGRHRMRIPLSSLLLNLLLTQTRPKMPRFPRFTRAMRGRSEFIWLFEDEGAESRFVVGVGVGGGRGGGIAKGVETEGW